MNTEQQSEPFQISQQEKQTKPIHCAQKNEAELLCTNDECSHFAFLCTKKSCKCCEQHEACMKLTIKSFVAALEKKRISFKSVEEKIREEIQKAIDNLSELQTVLLAKCLEKSKSLAGLTSSQKGLMKAIELEEVDKITGKLVWEIQLNLKKPQQVKNTIGKLQEDMKTLWSQLSKDLKQLETNFKGRLGSFAEDIVLFKDSKVIKSKEEQKIIEEFFLTQEQEIKSARKIYRGSDNNFSASKFHLFCDGVGQTITICQTANGKKIGGYTPLEWNSNGEHYTDHSYQSFVFSLTNNHKFVADFGSESHQFCHRNYGPVFGGSNDFVLRDACDQYATSNGSLNGTYKNSNYTRGSQESHERFSGSKRGDEFRVEEYEVWKLEFA